MAWQSDEAFLVGLTFFGDVVGQLEPPDWRRPSACDGWRELDVLGHVGAATRFGTALLRQEAPTWDPVEPPGAAVDGDPQRWWESLVDPARAAVSGVDLSRIVDSPIGQRSIGEGLSFPAVDLFVHAWDIAAPLGIAIEIPDTAIEFAHGVLDPVPTEQLRSARVFGSAVTAPGDATESDRFLAWTGRNPFSE